MKHSQSPWIATAETSRQISIYTAGEEGYEIAVVRHSDPETLKANACLIAAAPKMLTCLEHVVQYGVLDMATAKECKSVVAEARGQA